MDDETRFWIAQQVAYTKYTANINPLFKNAKAIEMNTITSPNGIVKTVESEKEAFFCRVTANVPQGFGSIAMKEVTIFTEIFEDLGQGKTVKMSEFTTCMKSVGPAPITSKTIICQASKPSVIPF